MREEISDFHYYKLIDDLNINLGVYKTMPMYDEHPEFGTFESTIGVSTPQKGDYIVCGKEYRGLKSDFNFEDICFSKKVNIKELLDKNILCEVSYEVYRTDIKLSEDIRDVLKYIANTKMSSYSSKEEQQHDLKSLKNQLDKLSFKRRELEKIIIISMK